MLCRCSALHRMLAALLYDCGTRCILPIQKKLKLYMLHVSSYGYAHTACATYVHDAHVVQRITCKHLSEK